jgi:DNA-binding GntR family transcriptional regulator
MENRPSRLRQRSSVEGAMSAARPLIRRVPLVAAPLRKQVIELLRNAIITFEYAPGQRLVERDLCERFEVSRTVIREALRHLEAEGLVELVANRGPVVSVTTAESAKNLYEVREALESLAAKCCATRATPIQKKGLRRALARIEASYSKGVLADELHEKDEFYRILCEGAGNPVITSTLRSIWARVQVLRGLSLQTPGRTAESLVEIQKVVAAIEKGDSRAAAQSAADHVRHAGATALARLAELEEEERQRAAQ